MSFPSKSRLFFVTIGVGIVLLVATGCRAPQGPSTHDPTPPAPDNSGQQPSATQPPPATIIDAPAGSPEQLRKIFEVWNILSRDFVDRDKLDPDKSTTSAIEAIVDSLDDPYTAYIDADHFPTSSTGFDGSFEGIGALVTIRNNRLTIVSPFEDSPAAQAGIQPGDMILRVDGTSTDGMTITQAVNLIRGPKGSEVVLTVLHPNEKEPVDITVVRGKIDLDTVSSLMLDDNIAHLKISQFTQRTPEELRKALQKIKNDGTKGIILDLRGNPGGLLGATVDATSEFLEDGVILYEVDSQGNRKKWETRKGGLATDLPMVILINSGSASGSEVLAGALQDHGRAPLIGMQTFGKGSVNILRRLSDGSGLYITTARWQTPNGNLIEGEGLKPDFEVIATPEDRRLGNDPQLEKGVEYLLKQLPNPSK